MKHTCMYPNKADGFKSGSATDSFIDLFIYF